MNSPAKHQIILNPLSPGDHLFLWQLIKAATEYLDDDWVDVITDRERASIDRGNDPKTRAGEAYFLSKFLAEVQNKMKSSPQ